MTDVVIIMAGNPKANPVYPFRLWYGDGSTSRVLAESTEKAQYYAELIARRKGTIPLRVECLSSIPRYEEAKNGR